MCVEEGTNYYKIISKHLPKRKIVETNWVYGGPWEAYLDGRCNVVVESDYMLAQTLLEMNGVWADFVRGKSYFEHEPQTTVTRSDDPRFVDFINAVLQALLHAEYHNITQSNADTFPQTDVFGEKYKDMFRNAIAAKGNFGQLYDLSMGYLIPRSTFNSINNGSTGLLYPHPFGLIENGRDGAPLGDALQAILLRGKLRCGIPADRPGFATKVEVTKYIGMNIDYCRALSASLFLGDAEAVDYVEIEQPNDGYTLLASNDIDVLSGATWTLANDVHEPTTGKGYTFSPPYFYGYSSEADNFCLATRQDDHDWSTFVHWVVTSTFYAEDQNITSASFNSMPEVFVYGPEFRRMFRDVLLRVGNYAEMHERNLEPLYPRGGRNRLNSFPNVGPQHYLLPGFI